MKTVLRFIACSDLHIKEDIDTERLRFAKGLKLAYKYAETQDYKNIDALYIIGDFADRGKEGEMRAVKKCIDENVSENTQVVLTLSSHEFMHDGEQNALNRFHDIFCQAPDLHKIINGFHFISLTTERGCRIDKEKQEWLKNELANTGDDFKKPVFVFQHPHLTDTVYGSIDWGEDDIISILMDYPQIIDFSGHSHAPINDPRSIHQKYFTSLGTGSMSYFELDEFDKIHGTVPENARECAQFYIVEVFENNSVLAKPLDILSGNFFHSGYCIEKPWAPESFIYTDERFKTENRPYFAKDSFISQEVNAHEVKITFGQAKTDSDRVDSYTVTVKDRIDGHIVKQLNITSSYYLYEMPETLSVLFPIRKKGEYEAFITANSFWKTSSAPISVTFEVK